MGALKGDVEPQPPAYAYAVMESVLPPDWFVRNRREPNDMWLRLPVTGVRDGRRTEWHLPPSLCDHVMQKLFGRRDVRVQVWDR